MVLDYIYVWLTHNLPNVTDKPIRDTQLTLPLTFLIGVRIGTKAIARGDWIK